MTRITSLISQSVITVAQRITLLAGIGAVLLCSTLAHAQSSTSARLAGSVTDSSAAIVPNVQVTVKNVGTNLTETVESDSSGNYAFNSLPVGQYQLTATGQGFAPLVET